MRRKLTPAWSRFMVALVGLVLILVLSASVMAAPSVRRLAAPSSDYPLATCVVTGMELEGSKDLRVLLVDGTEIQVCCSACETMLRQNPTKYLHKFHELAGH